MKSPRVTELTRLTAHPLREAPHPAMRDRTKPSAVTQGLVGLEGELLAARAQCRYHSSSQSYPRRNRCVARTEATIRIPSDQATA
jgi:hypothetical protein